MPYREIYEGKQYNKHNFDLQYYTLKSPVVTTTETMTVPLQTGWSTESLIAIIVVAVSFTLLFLNLLYLILKVFKKQMGCTSFFLMCFATCIWNGAYKLVLKTAAATFPTITEPKTTKTDVGTQMFYSIPLGMGLANGAMASPFVPGRQQHNGYAFTILCVLFFMPRCLKRFLILLLLLHGVFSIGDHSFPHPVGVQQETGMQIRYIDVEECTDNGMIPVFAPHNALGRTFYHVNHVSYTTLGNLPILQYGTAPFYILLNTAMTTLSATCPYNGHITHEVHITDSYVGIQTSSAHGGILADATWLTPNYDFTKVNWFPSETALEPQQCVYYKTPCSLKTHQCSPAHTLFSLGGTQSTDWIPTAVLGDSRLSTTVTGGEQNRDMTPADYASIISPGIGHDTQLSAIPGNAIWCSFFKGVKNNFYKNYGNTNLLIYEGINWCNTRNNDPYSNPAWPCFGLPYVKTVTDDFDVFFPQKQRENFYDGIYSTMGAYANFDTYFPAQLILNNKDIMSTTDRIWTFDPPQNHVYYVAADNFPSKVYVYTQMEQSSVNSKPFKTVTLNKHPDFECFLIPIMVPPGAYAEYTTTDGTVTRTPTSPDSKYRGYASSKCMIKIIWTFNVDLTGFYFLPTVVMGFNTKTKVHLTVVLSYANTPANCPTIMGQQAAATRYADLTLNPFPGTGVYLGNGTDISHGSTIVRDLIHKNLPIVFPRLVKPDMFYQAHLGCIDEFLPCDYNCFLYGPHFVCPGHCEDGEVHGFFTVFLTLPPGATLHVARATSTCSQSSNSTVAGAICLGYNLNYYETYNCTFSITDYHLRSNCHFSIALLGNVMQYLYDGINLNGYNRVTVYWENKQQEFILRQHHSLFLGTVDLFHVTWWDWINMVASLIVLFSFLFLVLHVHKWPIWMCYWAKNLFVWSPPEHPAGTCPLCGADVSSNWSTHYMYHHAGIMDFFTIGYWIYRNNLPPLNLKYAKKGSRWIQTRAGSHYKYNLFVFILLLIFCCRPQAVSAIKITTSNIGDAYSGNFQTFSILDVKEQGQCVVEAYGCLRPTYQTVGGLTCVAHTRPPTCCDNIDPVTNSGHGGQPWCVKTSCMGGWTTGCFYIGFNCLYVCAYTICPYGELVPYVRCKTSTTLILGVDGQICDISSGNYKCGNASGIFTTTTIDDVMGYLMKDGLYATTQSPAYIWGNVTGESMIPPICSYYVKHTGAVDTTCTGAQSIAYNERLFDMNSNGIIRVGGEGDIVPDVMITAPICPETQPTLFTCWHYYGKYQISFVFNNCTCSLWQQHTYACHVTYYSESTTCCINDTCMEPTTGPNWTPTELGFHTTDPTQQRDMSVLEWFQSMFSSWSTWIIMLAVIIGIIILLLILIGCCKSRTKQA